MLLVAVHVLAEAWVVLCISSVTQLWPSTDILPSPPLLTVSRTVMRRLVSGPGSERAVSHCTMSFTGDPYWWHVASVDDRQHVLFLYSLSLFFRWLLHIHYVVAEGASYRHTMWSTSSLKERETGCCIQAWCRGKSCRGSLLDSIERNLSSPWAKYY